MTNWNDYNSKEKLGLYYTVLFPKLRFEKIRVRVKAFEPIVTNEELAQKGQVPIVFEGLHTWANINFEKKTLSINALATDVKRAGGK